MKKGQTLRLIATLAGFGLIANASAQTAVDLGLSVKWADRNIAASAESDYGNFYAWGETTTKTSFWWTNYQHGDSTAATKYKPVKAPSNEKDDWTNATGIYNNNDKAPERYKGDGFSTGRIIYRTITGLEPSTNYTVTMIAIANVARDLDTNTYAGSGIAYVFANSTEQDIIVGTDAAVSSDKWQNYVYDLTTTSNENGEITIGIANRKKGGQWYIARAVCITPTLNSADDVATKNWGNGWRTPTCIEMNELYTQCTWTWTTRNGRTGYEAKSKVNDNSIFLPAAGVSFDGKTAVINQEGSYMTRSADFEYGHLCTVMNFNEEKVYYTTGNWHDSCTGKGERYRGRSVRAVKD